MATKKKGTHVPAPEWWKHLRWAKRVFWKRERRATKRDVRGQVKEPSDGH